MSKILCIALFFVFAAYGQQERIAIMNTVDDLDSIRFSDLSYLTDKLRDIAGRVLPKNRYGIMTQQSIVDRLGSQERAAKECKEASCLADLGRKISADYIAQGHIGRFSGKLTIKVELYSVKSGNLLGSFTGDSKNLENLLYVLEKESPKLFESMLEVPLLVDTANNFGIFEVKPAYLDSIGGNSKWNLTINDKSYPLGAIKLSPGHYAVRLSHGCYENVDFNTNITRGSSEVFDMARLIKLKKAGLVLSAERDGEPVNEPVFVNGKLVGETPVSGSVSLCSKIEMDGKVVNVKLEHNKKVEYTHKMRKKFGILEVKPVYLDGMGKDSQWDLAINGESYPLGEIELSPGNYAAKLSHECYESMNFNVSIDDGGRKFIDMAKYMKPKRADLVLNAVRGEPVLLDGELVFSGKPVSEPVFVNGKLIGETPFSGSVPLCSKIEIDDETVNVKLVQDEKVTYTHNMLVREYDDKYDSKIYQPEMAEGIRSFVLALALDMAGVAFFGYGISKNVEANKMHDKYRSISSYSQWDIDSAWNKVDDAKKARNVSYVLGSILLATGIGVHIWF